MSNTICTCGADPCPAEDKAIAEVVLAGWTIQQFSTTHHSYRIELHSPKGGYHGSYGSRYSAALGAKRAMASRSW